MYRKEQNFLNTEHRRNLQNLQRRIRDVTSVNQKKKNSQDPYLHPTYLFRPVSPNKRPTSPSYSPERAKTLTNPEPYIQFKDDIMNEIVSKRLYKESDILEVFEKHKDAKQELDPYWVNQVLVELSQELYIPI